MNYENRKKFEVIRGTRFGLTGPKRHPAGYALNFTGSKYFVLKLWFQPDRTYFVCPNEKGDGSYTIYGRKTEGSDAQLKFQNPIGHAQSTLDRMHLELILPDLSCRYYMSLFPAT